MFQMCTAICTTVAKPKNDYIVFVKIWKQFPKFRVYFCNPAVKRI